MADPVVGVDPAKVRNLKIKSGVVRRYTKEKLSYEKEVTMQQNKIKKFEEEGKDEYFMKQQVNSLRESELMVPDTQRRLSTSYKELKEMTVNTAEWNGIEEYKTAMQILQEAEPHLPADN